MGLDRPASRPALSGTAHPAGDRIERGVRAATARFARCRGVPPRPGRLDRGEVRPRRPGERVQRGHRLRLRRPRQRGRAEQRRGRGGGDPGRALQQPAGGPLRRGVRRTCRDARSGQREPTGQQLRGPRGVGPRREADLLRADHATRQLVELPAAQARRLGALRGGQRGDLLLPDRRLRPGHAVARGARLPPHVHRSRARRDRPRADRRDARGPRPRRGAGPARLPRTVHGLDGLPDVLPQRARRPRRPGDAVLRRPGPCLDQGQLVGRRGRPPLPGHLGVGTVGRPRSVVRRWPIPEPGSEEAP